MDAQNNNNLSHAAIAMGQTISVSALMMAETICCGTAGVTSAEFQGFRTFGVFYAVHVPSTDYQNHLQRIEILL